MPRHKYLLFRFVFFAIQLPVGISFPYLLLHLRNDVGFSPRQVSYVMIMGGLTILLLQQLWGYLGDVVCSKRWLIAANSAAASILFYVVGKATNPALILGLMFLFHAVNTPLIQLLQGFLFTHPGSEHRFGVLRAYSSLGFVIANMFVGLAADNFFGGQLGFIFPIYALTCSCAGLLVFLLPEDRTVHPQRPRFVDVQRFFFGNREVVFFLGIVLFFQAAHSFSFVVQSFLMMDMGADLRLVSFAYTFGALLELPVFFAAGWMIRRFGEVRIVMFAAVVQAVRWLLVWGSQTPEQVIFISTLHCITFGAFYAAGVSYVNKHAGPHLKASAQAVFALVFSGIASMIGNFLGGQVASGDTVGKMMRLVVVRLLHLPDHGDLRNLYVFSALLAIVAALACPILISWERSLRHDRVLGRNG